MIDTEQTIFNLGLKAGLQAAINLVADRVHCEHDRFEAAFSAFDDDTTHEALIRRNFAADILTHLEEIEEGGTNGRYPRMTDIQVDSSPEFNSHSDLPFDPILRTEEYSEYCENCGNWDDVEFMPDPYASEIGGDYTMHWLCQSCAESSAMDI